MEYANAGRLFREVGGAAKDVFVVHIKPRVGDFADKGKEIVLFPYKTMIVPIFQYIKSKLKGRKGNLVLDVNGKRINFIVPEKYTKLGLGRELNNIIRDHEDVLNFYENWPDTKLYIDTDMNIYELTNGTNSMVKIFGDGRFYDRSELKQIPVERVLRGGVRTLEDYIDRQRQLVNAVKDNFIPLSNIFPSSNQQEARDQLNDYLFEAFIHSKVSEDTKKIHKVERLGANSFSNLLERLKQERNLERETNMLERLETDEVFLRALSNKELAKKAEEIYNIYMKKGALSLSNWVDTLRKKDNATYYNSLNPFRNYYLEAMDDNIKSVQALAPSIKGLIGDRAKNLAIDAGIGALGSTAHLWVPAALGSAALLAQFLLKRAFKIRSVDRRIEYTEKLENLLETSIKLNEAAQLQFSGSLMFQQNSNNLMLTIADSIKQVKNDINNMNSEKNIKQLEYARKKVFDKIKKEDPDDQFIFKDQEIPFSESLRKIEVPEVPENNQKKLKMDEVELRQLFNGDPELEQLFTNYHRKYVVNYEDPQPLIMYAGKLRRSKKPRAAEKLKIVKEVLKLARPKPPLFPPDQYFERNDEGYWTAADLDELERKFKREEEDARYRQEAEKLAQEREIRKKQADREWEEMVKETRRKFERKVEENKLRGAIDKKPLPFTEPEFLKNYAYQGDNEKIDWQNLKVEDVYESPNKKIKTDWPNGTFPSTSEKIKDTAEKIWGKCFFIFLIF